MRAGVVVMLVVVSMFAACRNDEPKTPPNSPLPDIDKTNEPKPSPFTDAGASSSK